VRRTAIAVVLFGVGNLLICHGMLRSFGSDKRDALLVSCVCVTAAEGLEIPAAADAAERH